MFHSKTIILSPWIMKFWWNFGRNFMIFDGSKSKWPSHNWAIIGWFGYYRFLSGKSDMFWMDEIIVGHYYRMLPPSSCQYRWIISCNPIRTRHNKPTTRFPIFVPLFLIFLSAYLKKQHLVAHSSSRTNSRNLGRWRSRDVLKRVMTLIE